jgi:hypothetical protein
LLFHFVDETLSRFVRRYHPEKRPRIAMLFSTFLQSDGKGLHELAHPMAW